MPLEAVGQRRTFADKEIRNHTRLPAKGGRRKALRQGVALLRRDSVSVVAEGFDSTLTSGKVLTQRGKTPKETITNEKRKRLWGSCVEQFLSEKMSFARCQET